MIAVLRKNKVYNLFKDYFGEDRVDMQEHSILVWWPSIEVSNEYDESCTIKNLYAKIYVENNGSMNGYFVLNRTEYTDAEWAAQYCHSHVQRFSYSASSLRQWRNPCLGSGPIRQTMSNLIAGYNEDSWNLFIFELDQYVRHESIEGGPYIRLATIGVNDDEEVYIPEAQVDFGLYIQDPIIIDLTNKILTRIVDSKLFKFNYVDGCYGIAMAPIDIVIKVSNIFLECYNHFDSSYQTEVMTFLKERGMYYVCKMSNNRLYTKGGNRADFSNFENQFILKFKGEDKKLHVTRTQDNDNDENTLKILSPELIMYIIHRLLRTINYRFNGNNEERAARTGGTTRYL